MVNKNGTNEETRYAGQKKYNINLEFLYHLAKQIKAVAQYKIKPNENQIFDFKLNEEKFDYSDIDYIGQIMKLLEINIRNDFKLENDVDKFESYNMFEEELSKMAVDIQDLLCSINFNLISKNLVKLISRDFDAKEKLSYLINSNNLAVLREMDSESLCNLISFCDIDEIKYLMRYHLKQDEKNPENIANSFKMLNFTINDVINYSVYLKKKFNCRIDNNIFLTFIDFMSFIDFYYKRIDEDILEESNNCNKFF